MKTILFFILLIYSIWSSAQSPAYSIDSNNKYIEFKESAITNNFKKVAQLKIGTYLTLGNFGLTNTSWIGSNAILDYSSYGNVGANGDKNLFKPVHNTGTGLIMQLDFNYGLFKGYSHPWNGLDNNIDFADFTQIWEIGKNKSYFLSAMGIGTESIPNGYKLAVDGKVIAEEIKVELSSAWPDYVFNPDYPLPSLREVETHIKQKGHLKDIPSAAEVQEDGVNLGEMNAKLLQKIEELMLYTIQQQKVINEFQKRIAILENSEK